MAESSSNTFKLKKTRGETKVQGPKRGAPVRLKPSIKLDTVDPRDYAKYIMLSACEDCVHFEVSSGQCTLGYQTEPHLRAEQERTYRLGGRIAFCRFHEID